MEIRAKDRVVTESFVVSAVSSLLRIMRESTDGDWEHKAHAIWGFALRTSEAILDRAGFDPLDIKLWQANQLAEAEPRDGDDDRESSFIATLWLTRVPSTLDAVPLSDTATYDAKAIEHTFLFLKGGRVEERDPKTRRVRRVLTYEETARFVVFWFAERIIQIIRKNEWDRVRELPDLFDRITSLIAA